MRPRSRKKKRSAGRRNADFSTVQRAAGPTKSVPQERAASPGTGLFKGVWGRCHQQADWTSRRRREVQFCIVGPTMPCLHTPRSRCLLYVVGEFSTADNRLLLGLSIHMVTFQTENYVAGTLKKADVPFPTHAAFAMLQANELLLHLTPAARTELIGFAHSICQGSHPCSCRQPAASGRWIPARFSAHPWRLWHPRWPFWIPACRWPSQRP